MALWPWLASLAIFLVWVIAGCLWVPRFYELVVVREFLARFGEIGTTMKFADATGVDVWGPGPMEEHHHLDLSWYAIHPVETLYTLMGTGCARGENRDFNLGSNGDVWVQTDIGNAAS